MIIESKDSVIKLKNNLKLKIEEFKKNTDITPKLVILTVGNNPASEIYVNKKLIACNEVGIIAEQIKINEKNELIENIVRLNNDSSVHGYILQLPLPKGWDSNYYFSLFNPYKDVDVFHPENIGLLIQGRPRFKPCTPHGIQKLLYDNNIKVSGKQVCIINRSLTVGRPLFSMLIQECEEFANATVTICHDCTPPDTLKRIVLASDIVVVAVGKPNFFTADLAKEEHVIIDVGINRLLTKTGTKVVGDVDFENVSKIVRVISKVPGSVGLYTVFCLLENVFLAANLQSDAL